MREGSLSLEWPVRKVNASAEEATEWTTAVLVKGATAAPASGGCSPSVIGNLTLRHARFASEAMFIWKLMLVIP